MSGRRRNFDKVRRERAVYLRGSLPHWKDGWAPTFSDDAAPVEIRRDSRRSPSVVDPGQWVLLSLELPTGTDVALPPSLVGDTAKSFRATEVRYSCVGISNAIRNQLLDDTLAQLKVGDSPIELIPFVKSLSRLAWFSRIVTAQSCVTYEYKIKTRR